MHTCSMFALTHMPIQLPVHINKATFVVLTENSPRPPTFFAAFFFITSFTPFSGRSPTTKPRTSVVLPPIPEPWRRRRSLHRHQPNTP